MFIGDISSKTIYQYSFIEPTVVKEITQSVFKEDTKCRYLKPEETTWIKLEPKDNGIELTWTQYSADKIDILIDDGTDNFPWKIESTSNDGHELLPNVASWQRIKIRPVNHCAKGNYSNEVSLSEYPNGWFNIK